ncbi:MAG TPA: M23 family metallopeptidase [Candidatus Methylacidiphilales bacterium]|jgi:murein DD-endopeptidase MepM/ murein hydrolase activator NlpD|nr:M23 family metallopeptidase [Candidatus Methylacidiphilales bacterium]
MASRISHLVVLAAWIAALWWGLDFAGRPKAPPAAVPTTEVDWPEFFAANILPSLPVADEFDAPLRPPDGADAVVSLPFLYQGHLGEDWTTAKGDAALGEPVYSVADGWVSVAQDFENTWGKVIFICHRLPENRWPPFVEVMYAQLNSIDVHAGQFVKRGQRIGTVGNAGGTYSVANGAPGAHLHWEVRQTVGMGLGPGFDKKRDGWLGPSEFISAHRGPRSGQPLLPKVLNDAERPGWGTDY